MIGTDGGLVGSADRTAFFARRRKKNEKKYANRHKTAHAKARSARFCVPRINMPWNTLFSEENVIIVI